MSRKKIAVIGAGILGLSVARQLALKGAEVTVFERDHIGAGTSTTTFAWVNSNGKTPDTYHKLNATAIDEHVELQQHAQIGAPWLIQSGTYEWAVGETLEQRLAERTDRLIRLAYPAEQVSRQEIQHRLPEIRLDPQAGKLWFFPSECILYPAILLGKLWTEAKQHGAVLRTHSDIVALEESERGVSLTLADGENWQGDEVVLATGRWSRELMAELGLDLAMLDANKADRISCGFLAYTAPLPIQLEANLITPSLNIRPDGGGRLLLQAPDLDNYVNPSVLPPTDGFIAKEMLRRLRKTFSNVDHAKIERIAIGQRARPADGLPAMGYVTPAKRVYLMVTHSGMTLGPLLGRLVAEEMVEGTRSDLLQDFAPQRLLGKNVEEFPTLSTLHYPAAQ